MGIKLKVKLTAEDCKTFKDMLIVETKSGFVELERVQDWLTKHVTGKIDKQLLDDQRLKEIN